MSEIIFKSGTPKEVEETVRAIWQNFYDDNRDAITQIYVDWRINHIDPQPRMIELAEKYSEANRNKAVG